jgi:cytochrome c heme-lyase
VRYVIDFYSGAPQPGAQAAMHLDVRPALDSFGAALDRLRMQWRWVASGRWQEP